MIIIFLVSQIKIYLFFLKFENYFFNSFSQVPKVNDKQEIIKL